MNAAKRIISIVLIFAFLAFLIRWAFPNLGLSLIVIEFILLVLILWIKPPRSDSDSDQAKFDNSQEIKFEIFK